MPTPDEPTLPPSPPSDRSERSNFASCPPEEGRELPAPEEETEEDDEATVTGTERETVAHHAIAQEPTPEPETLPESSILESRAKESAVGDAIDAPSPVTSPEIAESDAPRVGLRGNSEARLPPQYLHSPPDNERVCSISR